MPENESTVQPDNSLSAEVNSTKRVLYMHDGTAIYVEAEDYDAVAQKLGLITVKYDLEDARNELVLNAKAFSDSVENSTAEMITLGYVRAEHESILNQTMGLLIDSYRHWTLAIGAKLPTEATIDEARSLKEAGTLDSVPTLKQYEKLIS